QAEDGIRDRTVTGVQTCALPISDPVQLGFVELGLAAAISAGIQAERIVNFMSVDQLRSRHRRLRRILFEGSRDQEMSLAHHFGVAPLHSHCQRGADGGPYFYS